MIERNLDIPQEQIADFCQRWHIRELALFGSVKETFTFECGKTYSLLTPYNSLGAAAILAEGLATCQEANN